MIDAVVDGVEAFKLTIWHRLGFGFCSAASPEDWSEDAEPILYEVMIQFDWADRLRILLSGRVMVSILVLHLKSSVALSVLPPGK